MTSQTLDVRPQMKRASGPARSMPARSREISVALGVPEFLLRMADVRQLRASLKNNWPRVRRD